MLGCELPTQPRIPVTTTPAMIAFSVGKPYEPLLFHWYTGQGNSHPSLRILASMKSPMEVGWFFNAVFFIQSSNMTYTNTYNLLRLGSLNKKQSSYVSQNRIKYIGVFLWNLWKQIPYHPCIVCLYIYIAYLPYILGWFLLLTYRCKYTVRYDPCGNRCISIQFQTTNLQVADFDADTCAKPIGGFGGESRGAPEIVAKSNGISQNPF